MKNKTKKTQSGRLGFNSFFVNLACHNKNTLQIYYLFHCIKDGLIKFLNPKFSVPMLLNDMYGLESFILYQPKLVELKTQRRWSGIRSFLFYLFFRKLLFLPTLRI